MVMFRTLSTGIDDLDRLLEGGFALDSVNLVLGPTSAGKTILGQQILFHHARQRPYANALYLATTPQQYQKTMSDQHQFRFYDNELVKSRVVFEDISEAVAQFSPQDLLKHIVALARTYQADFLVIDPYQPLHEAFIKTTSARRLFYELTLELAIARRTTLLINEWGHAEMLDAARTGIIDSILLLEKHQQGSIHRLIRVVNMRGRAATFTHTPFAIDELGVKPLREGEVRAFEVSSFQTERLAQEGIDLSAPKNMVSIPPVVVTPSVLRSESLIGRQITELFEKRPIDVNNAS